MRRKILEAFNETYDSDCNDFEIIKNEFSVEEILDTWLRYEGIIGYTRNIINLLGECEIYIEE